jgi:hypothetical protein
MTNDQCAGLPLVIQEETIWQAGHPAAPGNRSFYLNQIACIHTKFENAGANMKEANHIIPYNGPSYLPNSFLLNDRCG